MSILVRPVREQLEHDRLIRHLQAKYKGKRKLTVAVNVGDEQIAPVKFGALTLYPDLVLNDGRKVVLIVEVESGESTNNLEALYQWVNFGRAKAPFHLYVPVPFFETARRLCEANQARVSEIWTYRASNDGFDLVKAFNEASAPARQAAASAARKRPKPAAPEKGKRTGPKPKAAPKGAAKAKRPARQARPVRTKKPKNKPAGKRKR